MFNYLLAISQQADKKNYVMRNVNWGMTKEVVKNSERDRLLKETEDMLVYSTKYGKLYYYFTTENKLYIIKHENDEFDDNIEQLISMYNELVKKLPNKKDINGNLVYGPAKSSEEIWKRKSSRSKKESISEALSNGDVSLKTTFSNPKTYVEILLYKNKETEKVTFIAKYISVDINLTEKEKREKELLDNF